MRIVPDSTITLYTGVDIDNDEQLVFKNRTNQIAYFQSKIHPNGAYTPCTVVRKTGRLRVEKSGSIVSACNYLSFVNPSFDNKTIYARIVDYDYVNNECTEISYIIDYWQTWMFDVTFQDSYIEREHLSQADWEKADDNPYDQTILEFKTAESLPVGKDIEKPYYTIGGAAQSQDEDGAFIGRRVENVYSLHPGIGILVIFSNINLEYLDTNSESTTPPSHGLYNLLANVAYTWTGSPGSRTAQRKSGSLGCFQITGPTYGYLYRQFPGEIDNMIESGSHYLSKGGAWNSSIGQLTGTPFDTNRIKSPVNYVYYDPNDTNDVADLLAWFTDTDMLDCVLGIYGIPSGLMFLNATFGASIPSIFALATASGQSVTNKKLDLYPYTYFRLIAPNGDVKELKIEDFITAQTDDSDCTIGATMDIVEKPNLLMAPILYKYGHNISPYNSGVGMNMTEAMVFNQFPCLPYDIDGFKSQMAAVANSMIGNNTLDYQYEQQGRMSGAGAVKGALSEIAAQGLEGLLSKINGPAANLGTQIAQDVFGSMTSGLGMEARYQASNYNRTMNEANMADQAYDVLSGGTDNAIYNNFEYTKPAYAANVYHPINGDGVTNYNVNGFVDILFLRVALHPEILAQYDRYFSNYGYTSGRCGIPRVVNYARAIQDDDKVPHWQTINSKPTTYIKTRDCKVIHSMLPVAQFIKSMFDTGVRMIQGDPE